MRTMLVVIAGMIVAVGVLQVEAEEGAGRAGKGKHVAEMFGQLDTDADGVISREEFAGIRKIRRSQMKERAPKASRKDAGAKKRRAKMLKTFDSDGDGKLSAKEREAARTARVKKMLERFDADGSGELSLSELVAAMASRQQGTMHGSKPRGMKKRMRRRQVDE